MGVCRRCGSINTRELKGPFVARAVALLLRQRQVACQRCGWQGRVAVSRERGEAAGQSPRRSRRAATGDEDVATEPNLSAVDAVLAIEAPREPAFVEFPDTPRSSF